MKKTKLRSVSKKRQAILPEYHALIKRLVDLCGNVSELSGERPDWASEGIVEPHHIEGRIGGLLTDPFNIIMLTHTEHQVENGQIPGDKKGKEYLLWLVKGIRNRQGFKEV